MIYLGADHKGFQLKEQLIEYFSQHNIDHFDCGNSIYDPQDDYVDYALSVGTKVTGVDNAYGILICTSGEGMTIAANKVKGIRAALCHNTESVTLSREHNNANILVLDANHSIEDAIQLITTFLNTAFSNEERHIRRVKKIAEYEDKHIVM